jgi:acetyl/propionyl-CoA carboxylase alpha subunit
MNIINKILIANRGEIAVRVMKTARKLGIKTVAVYSEIDKDSLHVSFADESHCIGESELSDTYLNIEKIIGIAKKANCDAIHPGYGFMAEKLSFCGCLQRSRNYIYRTYYEFDESNGQQDRSP